MPKLLGFDLGLKYGWCCADNKELLFGHGKTTNHLEFFKLVCELIDAQKPDCVLYENAGFQRGIPARIWNDMRAACEMACLQQSVLYHAVAVGTIKKHIAGSGRACKEEVMSAVKNKGFNVTTYDESDAVALVLYAIETNLVEGD